MSERSPRDIALLTTSYPRFDDDPSGHFVEAHAHELSRAGHRVTVLAMGSPASERGSGDPALEVRWLGGEGVFGWPGASARLAEAPWRAAFALGPAARAALAATSFDEVVAHWIVPSAFPIAWLAGRTGVEVWAHGADVRLLGRAPRLARTVVARLLATRARFVFVARPLLEALGEVVGPSLRAALEAASTVRPAPIEVPERASLVDPRPASERASPYVVWVGRMVRDKRPAVAARAATAAGVRLVMIGDGPEAPSARGPVAVKGRLPRRDALAWIAHASALVCTSEVEGAPTVVREARALGVPVVTTPCGDVEATAAADPGVIVVRSEAALAAWLGQLATTSG